MSRSKLTTLLATAAVAVAAFGPTAVAQAGTGLWQGLGISQKHPDIIAIPGIPQKHPDIIAVLRFAELDLPPGPGKSF